MGLTMNNKWVIYTSSYDRGLEHLLKMWSDVKEEVPEAQLHIFYGWQLFEDFYKDNPGMMAWKENMDKLMEQDGITHHGRVPQHEMVEWHKKCGIWAYSTHFDEISCISAMKAQAWGSIPVVINKAALKTTVQHGIKIDGDIYDDETKEEFKEELTKLLKDDDRQEEIREPMMEWAKEKFSWKKVAEQWDREFGKQPLVEAGEKILEHDEDLAKYFPVQLQQKMGLKETY